MSEQKINKMNERKERARKRELRNKIIFTLVCILIFAGMIVGIVLTQKNNKKKAEEASDTLNANRSNTLYSVTIDEDQVAAYTNGLNTDGTITGIDNIDDYVTLGDYESIVIHDDDFEALTSHGQFIQTESYVIGEYLLDELTYISEVELYEPYYEAVYALNDYIYNQRFEKQNAIYESQGLDTWSDVYNFYAMTEAEYYYYLESTSKYDAESAMICQALANKLGVTVSSQDMLDYCVTMEDIASSESQAQDVIDQYGEGYIAMKTLEWKLKNKLGDITVKAEGGRTDSWVDQSDIYSSGLYESGKIDGVGKISIYCDFDKDNYASIFESATTSDDVIEGLLATTEFYDIETYREYCITLLREEGMSDDEIDDNIDYVVNRDILIQYLFEDYDIEPERYVEGFLRDNGLDLEDEAEIIYTCGEGYFNRLVMNYSVSEYINMLIDNRQ